MPSLLDVVLEGLKTVELQTAAHILMRRGHVTSAVHRLSLDGEGNPLPWITYPAIDYLSNLDLSQKHLFEYGSGSSTAYWSGRCKQVTSVEHNRTWHHNLSHVLSSKKISNVILHLREREAEYLDSINEGNARYDLIVIDGGFNRKKMAEQAIRRLQPGGLIVLDNSDCHVGSAETLATCSLRFIPVHFAGFAPGNQCEQVTSFYFHRDFNFSSFHPWPKKTIGCMKHIESE